MYSDEGEHSESEFYYPDEDGPGTSTLVFNEKEKENTSRNEQISGSDVDIQKYIESQRPETTKMKTVYDINVLARYFRSINEVREIQCIPAKELNVLLARFFVNIRKKNDDVYEPSSLTAFQRSLQRFLNDKSSKINIFQDKEFSKSREVLVARKRELVTEHAKGNRPQAARVLTEAEEDLLFDQGLFGDHDPEVLQRTVWWVLALHFGFRARDESRRLQWGDITVEKDVETGNEVLKWHSERLKNTSWRRSTPTSI